MRNVFDKSCRGNQNTRFVVSRAFARIVPFIGKCGKILSGKATDDNMAHALCMLGD
jgi:hypothetical protein